MLECSIWFRSYGSAHMVPLILTGIPIGARTYATVSPIGARTYATGSLIGVHAILSFVPLYFLGAHTSEAPILSGRLYFLGAHAFLHTTILTCSFSCYVESGGFMSCNRLSHRCSYVCDRLLYECSQR